MLSNSAAFLIRRECHQQVTADLSSRSSVNGGSTSTELTNKANFLPQDHEARCSGRRF